jgi:predicted NUDIX family NTP pyrophosphohydrolase
MAKTSAGILVFKRSEGQVKVLLAHHGGPFWAKKDNGAWSIIKGETDDDEAPFEAAKREFKEETSHEAPNGKYIDLDEIKRKDGKTIKVWAVEADFDPKTFKCDTFEMEWPPKSGKIQKFPENDRAEWFKINEAGIKMNTGQSIFLERLAEKLNIQINEPKSEELNQQQLL